MFQRVYIEISNICNVQCSFCPVVERDKEIMSLDQFRHILTQAAPLTKEVCLHLMGEPLAHPKISSILDICYEQGVQVQLTTNGLLLKRYGKLLSENPIIRQINFSIQAYMDNFPQKDITPYLHEILEFIREAQAVRADLYTNLRLWNLKEASDPKVNEKIFKIVEDFFKVTIKREVDPGHIKSKRVWERLYLHFDSRFEWPSESASFKSAKGRCHGLSGHIGIHSDGTVVPCCLDSEARLALGNCLEDSLTNVLQGTRALAMRDGFSRGELVEDMCQRCDYIQRFNKS